MGSLRFILALSVVYGHAGDFLGFPLIPGDTAVQSFYAISGFYMALVLNEKYRPESSTYFLFISNRFTRLFPIYATVLVLTLLLAFAVLQFSSTELPFIREWRSLPALAWSSDVFLLGSQLLMWGQDLYFFLTLKAGAIVFWPDFHTAPQRLDTLLAIPQGWTLGLEFSFYLIAPFIVRRPAGAIAVVLAASLLLRLGLQFGLGYYGDPWSYRFFPSEIAVFLVGALAYRIYSSRRSGVDRALVATFVAAIVCVGAALLVNRWHGITRVASVCFLLTTFGLLPFLFRTTKHWMVDRHLGELSYPIYVCHLLVIWLLDALAVFATGLSRGVAIVAVTIVVSCMLYWWVDRPIDDWRQRRLSAARAKQGVPTVIQRAELTAVTKPAE
jgi:peptidoglycan/LPS O-acetylase OafA/YrhL